tara:strand:+ start:5434 stop:6609 length:1176 start_codon:yes stop_codon:yes gene_type:complete
MVLENTALPVIVVIAFNRPNSLSRILMSISKANYPSKNIDLVISIDKTDNNQNVLEIANKFNWNHGTKKVIYQSENLGLRKHIIKSMSIVHQYDSMIMLEDDLFVSPDYYNYTQQALNFSYNNDKIGGISLYNHQLNVYKDQNFTAIDDGFDNWYFQFASSWGQAWNVKHIKLFLEWYETNPEINALDVVPKYVRNWSDKSWLKYFISFVIIKNKYFMYPKISLTTNFGDQGVNMDMSNTYFQVPILNFYGKKYNFSKLEDSHSIYDAFYENLNLNETLGFQKEEITIDLYGYKNIFKRYLLSSQQHHYFIIKTFGRSFKPHDLNILYNIEGKDFYLYDTEVIAKNKFNSNPFYILDYNIKMISLPQAFSIFKFKFEQRLKIFLYNIFKRT